MVVVDVELIEAVVFVAVTPTQRPASGCVDVLAFLLLNLDDTKSAHVNEIHGNAMDDVVPKDAASKKFNWWDINLTRDKNDAMLLSVKLDLSDAAVLAISGNGGFVIKIERGELLRDSQSFWNENDNADASQLLGIELLEVAVEFQDLSQHEKVFAIDVEVISISTNAMWLHPIVVVDITRNDLDEFVIVQRYTNQGKAAHV